MIADPGVRVVVFTAAGDHFSAGADLKEFGTAPSLLGDARRAVGARRVGAPARGRGADARVDARLRGRASASSSRCSATLRIAADDCVVALPEARVGMIPAGGARQTLPRVVGHQRRRSPRSSPASGSRRPTRSRAASSTRSCRAPSCVRAPTRSPTRSRRARRRRCARPRPRCGRRSTSRSPSGLAREPTSRDARRRDVTSPDARLASGACLTHAGNRRSIPSRSAIPEEYDKLRRRVLWKMPSGLYVLGSHRHGRAPQRHDASTGSRRCRSTRSWSA